MTRAQRVLRGHGVFLAGLGTVLFTSTLVGRLTGRGMFGFLQGDAVAAIGLHEAYGLVAMLGVALVLGAAQRRAAWHVLAASVHLFLAVINVVHWDFYARLQMQTAGFASTALHVVLIAVEGALALGIARRAGAAPPS